jgi:exodeoxyribonuclease VII small subunit
MDNTLTFEQSLAKLSEISTTMNGSELPLEESLKLYGEAVGLIDVCKRRIETAKLTIEKIESNQSDLNITSGGGGNET